MMMIFKEFYPSYYVDNPQTPLPLKLSTSFLDKIHFQAYTAVVAIDGEIYDTLEFWALIFG